MLMGLMLLQKLGKKHVFHRTMISMRFVAVCCIIRSSNVSPDTPLRYITQNTTAKRVDEEAKSVLLREFELRTLPTEVLTRLRCIVRKVFLDLSILEMYFISHNFDIGTHCHVYYFMFIFKLFYHISICIYWVKATDELAVIRQLRGCTAHAHFTVEVVNSSGSFRFQVSTLSVFIGEVSIQRIVH